MDHSFEHPGFQSRSREVLTSGSSTRSFRSGRGLSAKFALSGLVSLGAVDGFVARAEALQLLISSNAQPGSKRALCEVSRISNLERFLDPVLKKEPDESWRGRRDVRRTASEKVKIIRLVEHADLPAAGLSRHERRALLRTGIDRCSRYGRRRISSRALLTFWCRLRSPSSRRARARSSATTGRWSTWSSLRTTACRGSRWLRLASLPRSKHVKIRPCTTHLVCANSGDRAAVRGTAPGLPLRNSLFSLVSPSETTLFPDGFPFCQEKRTMSDQKDTSPKKDILGFMREHLEEYLETDGKEGHLRNGNT